MYKYETHMHTFPVSRCAKVSAEEAVAFYKAAGYDGVFVTNHFPTGNGGRKSLLRYEEELNLYFSDYDKAVAFGKKIGIKVFFGIEISNSGTDFLVYGLSKEWYLKHLELSKMRMSHKLKMFKENGAFIVQAHPFREAEYIDHIRLYPRHIEAVEVINANRTDFENGMAEIYAESYGLSRFAGSDNHLGKNQKKLAGMCAEKPIVNEHEFIKAARKGKLQIFTAENK